MSETVSVVIVGVGGQGVLLASEITALAARHAGFRVKTNEVHGMAQRGGSVLAQIRYGHEVHSPLVEDGGAQVLASLERIEALRQAQYLCADGLAVVNAHRVIPVTVSMGAARYPADAEARLRETFERLVYFDAVELAEQLGNMRTSNVIILGAVSRGLKLPIEAWHAAVAESVPEKHRDLNLKAFEAGRSYTS